MRKALVVALAVTLFTSVGFAADSTSASGPSPVTINAIIPSYIGLSMPSVASVTFDYSYLGAGVATGLPITKLATGNSPSWTLSYNLVGSPTITVCAYASPLTGTNNSSNSIPTSSIYAATGKSGTNAFQFNSNGCGQTGNAIVMDTITGATHSTGTAEALEGMFMQTPNGTVIAPDTYTGSVNIIAQVQ